MSVSRGTQASRWREPGAQPGKNGKDQRSLGFVDKLGVTGSSPVPPISDVVTVTTERPANERIVLFRSLIDETGHRTAHRIHQMLRLPRGCAPGSDERRATSPSESGAESAIPRRCDDVARRRLRFG